VLVAIFANLANSFCVSFSQARAALHCAAEIIISEAAELAAADILDAEEKSAMISTASKT
jgi:hypothetical protein